MERAFRKGFTEEKCPLVEPEIGRVNSCQNGLSEQKIINSTSALIHIGPGPGSSKKKNKLPLACRNVVWDEDHPKCHVKGEKIPSPIDMD